MSEAVQTAVKSADRVLDLFELLADSGRELGHADIADVLQIPKSSLTQLLRTLIARGYVEVTPTGRGYRLGQTLLVLSQTAGNIRDLAARAEAFLADLTRETGESSALYQIKGDEAEVSAAILGPARLVTHMRVGELAPLYATSGGKAILAHMPVEFLKRYMLRVRFAFATPTTIKSTRVLSKQLAAIRTSGFAYSHEEWTPGITGIGVVILDKNKEPLGAVSVAMPTARFNPASQDKAEQALARVREDMHRHLYVEHKGKRQHNS